MDETPRTFDWVKAHFECSLRNVFLQLTEVVDSDVKAVASRARSAKLTLNKPSPEKFVVAKTWDAAGFEQGASVVFELLTQGIGVKDGRTGKQLLLAKPSLMKSGDCKLRIDGESEPLELWQVSRKALEDLFFGSPI